MNMKNRKVAFMFALCATAGAFGETVTVDDLCLAADTTVDVAAGATQNVVRLTGGAYTLTKTGGGTLNIYWTSNETARVVVEEGVLALPRYTKPTSVFAKAHFHVDASDASTLETVSVGGTNFIVRWNDADGRAVYATNCLSTAAGRTNPENRKPFIRPCFQNGLPVVDFGSLLTGSYVDGQGNAIGYGGAMLWSEPLTSFREGFTVFSDTDEVYDAERMAHGGMAASLFASFARDANYRGYFDPNNAAQSSAFYENIQPCFPLSRSTNVLDLVTYYRANKDTTQPVCTYTAIKKGFHILNGITSAAFLDSSWGASNCFYVDAFAAARKRGGTVSSFGGQRIGEYAVFPDWLSQAERDEVSIYLKTKWFPRKFASVDVKSGAAFDASEGGVSCSDFRNESGATLLLGASTAMSHPVRLWKTMLHLDASAADTLDIVEIGGTNFVRKWSDWLGNGAYATNMNGDARMPFVNPTETLNGRPFVDFGSLRTPYNTNDVGEALGYGASLKFNSNKTGVAEGVTVAADTPDVVNGDWLVCPEHSKMHAMSFFSNNDYLYGVGTRGLISDLGTPKIHQYDNQYYYYMGINVLDGKKLSNSGSDWNKYSYNTRYPAGFHVFSHAPTMAATFTHLAEAKCYDSTVTTLVYGGQRIAEYALYRRKLTDDERTRAYRALRWKWFAETPMTRSCAALSIPEGASYEVMCETMSVDGPLVLGGKVGAISVSASNVVVSSSSATVAAPLTLASGAVLEFSRLPDGSFTSLTAESVAAEGGVSVVLSADDWRGLGSGAYRIVRGAVSGSGRWSVSCAGENCPAARLVVDSEGVSVTFSKGMIIIFK